MSLKPVFDRNGQASGIISVKNGGTIMNHKNPQSRMAIVVVYLILSVVLMATAATAQTTRIKTVVLGFESMEGDYGLIVKTTNGNFIYYQDKSSKRMDDLLNESMTKKMPIIIINGPKYINDVQRGR
jgi:hypothetical protein